MWGPCCNSVNIHIKEGPSGHSRAAADDDSMTSFQIRIPLPFESLQWMNLFPNFDNLGWAMLILMVATSLNGYTPYMVQAMSAPNHTGETEGSGG